MIGVSTRRLYPAHSDNRGAITDLFTHESVHAAHLTCRAGAVRGNHYHLTATCYLYVLSGAFVVRSRRGESPNIDRATVLAGEMVTFAPLERHSLTAVEDSSFIMFTVTPSGGAHYAGDTVREAP